MTREKEIREASIDYQLSTRPMAIGGDAFTDDARKLNVNTSFIAGAEWADAHPYWVSVDEALPECNIQEMEQIKMNRVCVVLLKKMSRVCVVLLKNGTTHIATLNQEYTLGEKDGEPYWFDEIRNLEGMWLNRLVTHWMPLPTPPTKKGGEQ